ncbi:MAG: ShlB/FhaC/HecB family hemolysin secretion/activation protein [Gammaproteobacteria bacterium]|nr:ShlB/FhaC/HecB family hemolysin secretion/activation protein [Gammaproteobacteria bacterium]
MIATALLLLAGTAFGRAPDPGSAAARFDILEYRVLGNTLLGTRTLERAVYPHLGPDRSFSDVQAARAALEKAYHDAGYSTVYVDIPEQTVGSGVIRLRVTEGRLDRVHVIGARYFYDRRLVAALPALKQGTSPYFPALQKELVHLNQLSPDLAVAPILKPGPLPATVDVELKVKDSLPLHGNVEVNDRYTADTTHTRLTANLSYDNLFQRYQTLSLQYQTAPANSRDARVLAATYLAPIPDWHSTVALFAVKTDSDVATVGTLAVLGKGRIYGGRYIMQLPRQGHYYPTLTFGADFKDFDESVLLTAGGGVDTPIRYMNWSIVYGGSFPNPRRPTSFTIGANFGVRGLVNDAVQFESKRALSNPDYVYWHADVTHTEPLPYGAGLLFRAAGQYAVSPLIDNEQFAIGGVDTVRGYLEAEALGDMGIAGTVELHTPSARSLFGVHPREAYAYLFYDAGVVSLIDALPSQAARTDLQGFGLGLRIAGFDGIDAALDWAWPRIGSAYERPERSRIHFHFRYGF